MSTPRRIAFWTTTSCLSVVIIAMSVFARPGKAADGHEDTNHWNVRARIGLAIAPVPLNTKGKNLELVGYGSYLVNAVGGCNGCHSAGPPTQFAPGFNPFMGQQARVNPATYLGGGRDFGALIPGSAHIISRNLTPDRSGRPEGGASFDDFKRLIRTGVDDDHLHPTCTGAPAPNCVPKPFDGELLQVMPWPELRNMTDYDLRAIYEYLSAVPCIQGNYPGESPSRCRK